MDRNLDGIYFRVERGGKWMSVCFSDMTPKEREIIGDRPAEWWKAVAEHLADCLREIGDEFDIMRG